MNEKQQVFLEELRKLRSLGAISESEYLLLIKKYQVFKDQEVPTPIVLERKAPNLKLNKKQKREYNLSVLFTVGISLILLSAIILIVSTWNMMSDMVKVVSMSSFDIAFFFASFIVLKYLKLKKTSFAFWNLGVLIIPVIICAIGYLGLLGDYLSFKGEGAYLYLGLAFIIVMMILLYSFFKYKSPLYQVLSILNLLFIITAFSLFLELKTDQIILLCNIVPLLMVIFYRLINRYQSILVDTYKIITEILVYVFPVIIIFFKPSIFVTLALILSVFYVIYLLVYKNNIRLSVFISPLAYGTVILTYSYIMTMFPQLDHIMPIALIGATFIMMIIALIIRKKENWKWTVFTSTLLGYLALLISIFWPELNSSIYATISAYFIVVITLFYIFLAKNPILKAVAQYLIIILFYIANLISFTVFKDFLSMESANNYTFLYHTLYSSMPLFLVLFFGKPQDKLIYRTWLIFSIIFYAFGIMINSFSISFYDFSLISHHLINFTTLILSGLLIWRYYKDNDERKLGTIFGFVLFTLYFAFIFYGKAYLFETTTTNLINLLICLCSVGLGTLKTNVQKPLIYSGFLAILLSLISLFILGLNSRGSITFLLIFLLTIFIQIYNLKYTNFNSVKYFVFGLTYSITILDISFFFNSVSNKVLIIGALFLVLNLFKLIKTAIKNQKIIWKIPNTYFSYMSFGLVAILIEQSVAFPETWESMIILTVFLAPTLFLLAYNEESSNNRIFLKSLAIFSIQIPYWYLLGKLNINQNYLMDFVMVPVIAVGLLIYYYPIKVLKEKNLILLPFIAIPLIVLLSVYSAMGLTLQGVVLIIVTLILIVGGFLKQNALVYFSGIIGLILTLFIVIYHLWEGSPWWIYLLVSGLFMVFIAGYNEYRKVKNK